MEITQNTQNRYDIAGILDPGKKVGKKEAAKVGIAGYKCKFIGWLLKAFHIAVSVKSDDGKTFYLNRKSFFHWLNRVQPGGSPITKELKSSHDSKFVQQAISSLLQIRPRPVDQPAVLTEPVLQEVPVENMNLPCITAEEGVTDQNVAEKMQWALDLKAIVDCPEVSSMITDPEELFIDKAEILPGLFLGRGDAEGDFDFFILATNPRNVGKQRLTTKNNYQIPLNGSDVDIYSFTQSDQAPLQNAVVFINDALIKGKKVLVCCQQGKDRSALVVAAYLMKKYGVTAEQAVNFMKSKRPIVTVDCVSEEKGKNAPYWDFLTKEFKTDFPLEMSEFMSYMASKL